MPTYQDTYVLACLARIQLVVNQYQSFINPWYRSVESIVPIGYSLLISFLISLKAVPSKVTLRGWKLSSVSASDRIRSNLNIRVAFRKQQ